MTLTPDRRSPSRPDPIPQVDRADRRDRGGMGRGRLAAVAHGGARTTCGCPTSIRARSSTAPRSRRPRTTSASPRSTRSSSTVVLVVVLALYARHGERFTRESAAGRVGTGMLLGMLGFAFVWFAQLPFGLAAALVGPPPRRVRGRLLRVRLHAAGSRWAGCSCSSASAIGIVMALGPPAARAVVDSRSGRVRRASACCSRSSRRISIPDQRPSRSDRLAGAADQLAPRAGRPDIPVKVEDVDAFTDEPNAFAAGLGPTRRVILWNTLLDPPFSDREVRVVIAHELAPPLARPHLEVVRLVRAAGRADGAAGRRRHPRPRAACTSPAPFRWRCSW